jgi:hypothetical protein
MLYQVSTATIDELDHVAKLFIKDYLVPVFLVYLIMLLTLLVLAFLSQLY